MNLPLELKSKVFDGASSLNEYKKIRLASELNDKELELLIEQEYHKKLQEAQDNIKKSKELHSKLPLIAQLYFLRNPIKKYNLLEYIRAGQYDGIYYLMTGTKTQILDVIKQQTRERLQDYNISEYVDKKVDVNLEVEQAMIKYKNDIERQINEFKLGSNIIDLISQSDTAYSNEDSSLYYYRNWMLISIGYKLVEIFINYKFICNR